MKHITLTQGFITLVDDADHEVLAAKRWYARKDPTSGRFYAVRSEIIDGKKRTIMMHRQILGLKYGDARIGDHVFPSATLDNRRENLRIADGSQSMANRHINRLNTSGFKNVYLHNPSKQWAAGFKFRGKYIHVGYYPTAQEAYLAYCHMFAHCHGEYARFK